MMTGQCCSFQNKYVDNNGLYSEFENKTNPERKFG